MMQLTQLLSGFISKPFLDVNITGLANDSRAVRPGYLFLAYPGEKSDGRDFIPDAIENGASAILYEALSDGGAPFKEKGGRKEVLFLPIENLTHIQSEIAARFYDYPSKKLQVIGVTGTNGKTSITHFLAQCFEALEQKCALIGTIGTGFLPNLDKASLTTPDPILLQQLFFDLHQKGAEHVAMEVSSHALEQGRVGAVNFDIAVFTQLSRDHLDYHLTMDNYGNSKAKLFAFPHLQYAVLNWDDEWGQKIALKHLNDYPIIIYTTKNDPLPSNLKVLRATDIETVSDGFLVRVQSPWGEGQFHCRLVGRFNVSNLLAVLGALIASGIEFSRALACLNRVSAVRGRMQILPSENAPTVVVDYSHTPDALMKGLQALREHCDGRLWCVFGCGGDRDPGKRPQMGEIAGNFADFSIITTDNSRSEDPEAIAQQILQGVANKKTSKIILDRAEAIRFAIDNANKGDMILIAGKGHEDYQIIGEKTYPFSDVEEARLALQNKVQA